MLHGHAQYENERLHTLLKEKSSPVFAHAEEDHAHVVALDEVHPDRGQGRHVPLGLGHLRSPRLDAQVFGVPGDRGIHVVAKKVNVREAVMSHGVDLDQLLVGAADVHVEIVGPTQGRQGRVNIDVVPFPPL